MSLEQKPDQAGNCPGQDALLAYTLGRLPGAALESLAAHISRCLRCDTALNQLQTQEDTLVRNLRRYVPVDAPAGSTAEEGKSEGPTVHYSRPAEALPAPPSPLPCRLGRYELLQELGRGGMGVVYLARQPGLNRLVALKVAFGGLPVEAEDLARYRTECRAIARLQHDHIVCIYDCGEEDSRPFFAMELLPGGSLAEKLAEKPLPEREAAVLVQKLTRAVQFAHQHGVLHRDLKPANVLLDAAGEVKLSDFGLAKLLDVDSGLTQSNAVMGTPRYMAPEQARGETRAVGPWTDVYGLGAILYEALTGQPPFQTGSRAQTLEQVKTQPPVPPSRRQPGLSPDLEAICLKCLEKNPEDRYRSAEALAEDLDRWLRGVPIRRRRWHERLGRALWRHRAACLIAVVGGLAIVGMSLLAASTHPDRPLWDIQYNLSRGKRVVLIGQSGGPRWSRWQVQRTREQVPAAPSEPFSILSWETALLELVPDPQVEAYRFSAEIRHEESNSTLGMVGLYVAHEQPDGPGTTVHQFIHCCFDDIRPLNSHAIHRLRPGAVPVETAAPVRLLPRGIIAGVPESTGIVFPGRTVRLFVPAGSGRTDWRKLTVEVTPLEVRAFWEDGRPVGTLAFQEIKDSIDSILIKVRSKNPDSPFGKHLRPRFSPRGGLGLYVYRGTASFRSVVLEPL